MNEKQLQFWEVLLDDDQLRGMIASHALRHIVRVKEFKALSTDDKVVLLFLVTAKVCR